jgi:hypothetical protein
VFLPHSGLSGIEGPFAHFAPIRSKKFRQIQELIQREFLRPPCQVKGDGIKMRRVEAHVPKPIPQRLSPLPKRGADNRSQQLPVTLPQFLSEPQPDNCRINLGFGEERVSRDLEQKLWLRVILQQDRENTIILGFCLRYEPSRNLQLDH